MYLLAIYWVADPMLSLVGEIWPPLPQEPGWRYGALGGLAERLLPPLMGSFTAVVAAHLFDSPRVQRALAAANGLLAALILLGSVVYVLAALQLRVDIPPAGLRSYGFSTVQALFLSGAAAIVLGVLSWGGFRFRAPPGWTSPATPPSTSSQTS